MRLIARIQPEMSVSFCSRTVLPRRALGKNDDGVCSQVFLSIGCYKEPIRHPEHAGLFLSIVTIRQVDR